MGDKLELLSAVLRVTGIAAGETIRGRKPVTTRDEVPASVRQLTPAWLTNTLGSAVPDAAVIDFAFGEGSDGTSSRRALLLSWNEAGRAAALPQRVYTKTSPRLTNRLLIGVTGAAGAEALFYNMIRPHLPIGAPVGYYSAWNPWTCRSIVITEDIAAERGATFADATALHVDRASAESMVAELAAYHGALWDDPRLAKVWKLDTAEMWQRKFNARTAFDSGALLGIRLAEEHVPLELHRRRKEIRPGLMRSLSHNVSGPHTLLHQDVHPNNWFRLPDGSLNLYDWQGIARGGWALDYSYAISAGLTPENRRAWERELLALYLDRLASAGGKPPTFEEAWLAYRQQMLHGFIFWTYTFTVGKIAPLQADAHVRTLIERTGQAMVDLETLDALERTPRWNS
ncbi:hypothetical protein ACWCPQ_24900 [Nocardia sp. NPDC001965]